MRPSGIELTSDHKRLRLEWAICSILIRVLSGFGLFGMTKLQSLSEGRLRVWMQSSDEIPGNLEMVVNHSKWRKIANFGENMEEWKHRTPYLKE